jgi:S-adenosylmethionine decarboxylase
MFTNSLPKTFLESVFNVYRLQFFTYFKTFWRFYVVGKGRHILIDCSNVPYEVCSDDQLVLNAMAKAAERAGATVISQVRYRFGHNSAPGFTAVVLLDESHCSAHSYADEGLLAMDIFTCGTTDPHDVLRELRKEIDLGDITIKECSRFPIEEFPEHSIVNEITSATNGRTHA